MQGRRRPKRDHAQYGLRCISAQEAVEALDAAAGFPRGTVARGSLAMGAGDMMEVVVFQRLTPMTRLANPFLQVFERGVAGGVAFFSLLNLKAAVLALETGEKGSARLNLIAAIMGIGSATNGVLVSTRALMPALYTRASFSGFFARGLYSTWALRLFGYGGALFDALSNWFKSAEQRRIGNHEAAKAYAVASFGLGLGGAALTTGGAALASGTTMAGTVALVPVWGWLVAGAILVGIGVWWMMKGDEAQFTPLSFWLNDGTFGKHETMGRTTIMTYATAEDETKAYMSVAYAPQLIDTEWKVAHPKQSQIYIPGSSGVYLDYDPRVVLTVAYPLEGTVKPIAWQATGNTTGGSRPTVTEDGNGTPLGAGGTIRTYVVTGLSKKAADRLTLIAAYTPSLLQDMLQTQCDIAASDAPFYCTR